MTKAVQDLMVEVERVRDAFHTAVFVDRDVDAALALASAECAVTVLPAGTGAEGAEDLRRWLRDDVVAHLPADLEFRRESRTGDRWRVVDEQTVSFTHDREMPWLLPGVGATGRSVEILAVSVVTVRRSLVVRHRALWDGLGLATALGVDPGRLVPAVTGG